MLVFQQSEATAAQRRFPVYLVDPSDGVTPVTGETGTPQVSKNGAAFGNTTNTLTEVGNGFYYVELTATELDTLGMVTVRYGSANVVEYNLSGKVVAFDPFDANMGLTNLDAAVSSRATQADILSDATPFAGGNVDAAVSSRAAPGAAMDLVTDALDAAALAAGAVDEIWGKTMTEPSAGAPPDTPDFATIFAWFWVSWVNLREQTATEGRIHNAAGTTLAERDVTDDGTTTSASKVRATN